jgi:hypothetical protein
VTAVQVAKGGASDSVHDFIAQARKTKRTSEQLATTYMPRCCSGHSEAPSTCFHERHADGANVWLQQHGLPHTRRTWCVQARAISNKRQR